MSIYTKKGDRGSTSLFEPNPKKRNRVSKNSLRIEAIGAVDEANSYLGVANVSCKHKKTMLFVKEIQRDLFQIGSILSLAPLKLEKGRISALEEQIDALEEQLPPLRNFLMPEGSLSATQFMYARALVRRAERTVVKLSKKESVPPEILQYLNRLSDLLFVIFRAENARDKRSEVVWIGKRN